MSAFLAVTMGPQMSAKESASDVMRLLNTPGSGRGMHPMVFFKMLDFLVRPVFFTATHIVNSDFAGKS